MTFNLSIYLTIHLSSSFYLFEYIPLFAVDAFLNRGEPDVWKGDLNIEPLGD